MPQPTDETLEAIAERLSSAPTDLRDFGNVLLAIYGFGYRGADFSQDQIDLVALRAQEIRNEGFCHG